MITGQHLAGTSEAGLDFVRDQEDILLATQLFSGFQISLWRNDYATFTLNRFDQESSRVFVDGGLECLDVAVFDQPKTGRKWTEVLLELRLVLHGDDCYCAAMEVAGARDDLGLVLGNAFYCVSPLARRLDRCLNRFGACVHWQCHVLPG